MSDMEKVIDKKLADARKRSDKEEEAKVGDKTTDQKKTLNSGSKNDANAKMDKADDKSNDTKTKEKSKDGDRKPDSSTIKKQDPKGDKDRKDGNTGGGKDREMNDKKSDSSKVDKESGKISNQASEHKKAVTGSKTNSENIRKTEPKDTSSKTKSDNRKTEPKDAKGSEEKHKETEKSRTTSKNRSREKSRSPTLFVRNYYYKKKIEERSSIRGGRSPLRRRSRSSSRRRTRSPSRRTRSPFHRRSPPPRRHDSRLRSSSRRSRSPRDRMRSPSRSHRSRSRSSERNKDPKALMAKKSFLDDLAVRFAQEGKEFPELEQYRCEINSQFVSYPNMNQFSRNAVEHVCNSRSAQDAYMDVNMYPQMSDPMSNPIVLTDPYNAYPMYSETSSLISYPMHGVQPTMNSPAISLDSPQPSTVSQFKQGIIKVTNSAGEKQNAGSQPSKSSEIWTKQEVKIRIKQALHLLDDADRSITKTGKFMYRAPTFYGNDVNENRSPVVQSAKNPLFAITSLSGENSDPFGNIPPKLKAVVNVLRIDEGLISQRIYQRHQKKQLTIQTERGKLEAEERTRRLQSTPMFKPSLQKTTQTDPTVCTDCLLRKIKVRYNEETQTNIVRTADSVAQTNPMPVQTVSEFGSITELTPNQVRAVSELIKYIKLTVTSGTLQEMRNSLKEDQIYNLNSDLRAGYQYFDAMVEHTDPGGPFEEPQEDESKSFDPPDDYVEPQTFIEDDNFVDEYEEFHRNFCPDDNDDEDGETASYSNPLLQSQPSSFQRTMDNRDSFTKNTGSFGNTGGNFGGPSRGQFNSQRGRGGGGRGTIKTRNVIPFNRRN